MRFWDSSAVIPLCVVEPRSANARDLPEGDPAVAVWWATRTECLSALTRRILLLQPGRIGKWLETSARGFGHDFPTTRATRWRFGLV